MSSLGITDLPEELLEQILRHVKDAASSDIFWNCLRTCRQFHRVGLGLYKGLGFAASAIIESHARRCGIQEETLRSNFHLSIDFDLDAPSQLFLALLKSLTIHVRHQRIAVPFSPSPGNDLVRSLLDVFKLTRRLTTFSLTFSDGWDFPNLDVPAIPQSMLAQLVEALPATVVNLELDTAGIDVPPSTELVENDEEKHLCYQISKVLTRLLYLRLRVGHVCDTILGFRLGSRPCCHEASCEYCTTDEKPTCALICAWQMRSMNVWLPWGQPAGNHTLLQAASALLDPSLRNPTVIILVHQTDQKHPERTSIINPPVTAYRRFSWIPQSNVSITLRERLPYFSFMPISGRSSSTSLPLHKLQDARRTCTEHGHLLSTPIRKFHISPSLGRRAEPGSTSPHAYMAEQTVENMFSWTQNSHLGPRFPLSEGDEYGKPFWKTQKLWACRFPECKERCETLVHLRGHHLYAHPANLHHGHWQGYKPCPSMGCDRVGANGFRDSAEVEQHLLGHHLRPCTLVEDTAGSSTIAES